MLIAKKHKESVIGFVATEALSDFGGVGNGEDEDFVIFTTGVNATTKCNILGQQYQTPASAISHGSDFIITRQGMYAAPDHIAAVRCYREDAWGAYLTRENQN